MANNAKRSKHDQKDFLSDGGKMERLIRAFDWSKTSLGPITQWPQSLRTMVNFILQSPVPLILLWNKDGVMIYNDAYSIFARNRHPALLGAKVLEGWAEVADFNRNVMAKGLKGKTLSYKNQELTLYRNNKAEQVWMDLNYSPVMDESNKPAGVIAVVVETSPRVLAEQKQKQAEETLMIEQKRLHDLFMRAPAAISMLSGPELVFTLANAPYRQLVGKDRLIDGRPLLEAIPDLEPELQKIINNVAFKGERFSANELPVTIDWDNTGKPFTKYLNFIYEPIFEDKKPDGIITFAYDITEQVKSRRIVEAQNKVLEMISGGAPLPEALDFLLQSVEKQSPHEMKASILLIDKDGEHLRHGAAPSLPKAYNKAIDGIAIGPEVGSCGTAAYKNETVAVSDIAKDPLWKNFKDLALQHNLRACWSTPLSSKGKVLGIFALYYPEPRIPTEADKRIIGFSLRTATLAIERTYAEQALQQQLQVTKAITDIATACLFMIDQNGTVTFINPSAQAVTGYSPEDAIGKPMHTLVHHSKPDGSPYPESECPLVKTYKHGEPNPLHEDIFFRKDGTPFDALIVGTPIPTRDGQRATVVEFRDISEEKRALENQRQLIAMTEQRNALAKLNQTKDDFIALASHQLRTPATAVKQYISLVMSGFTGGSLLPDQKKYLRTAYDSNERQLNIINDLLKTAQLDSLQHELDRKTYNVIAVVKEAIHDMQSAFEIRNQRVVFDSTAKSLSATFDAVEIKLVLANLLENASKYSYHDSEIKVTAEKKGKYVVISIKDKGVGISQDNMSRIFDKFTRIDNELSDTVTGTGLGLYWVKQIAELHNGSVKLTSIPGKGSTFTLRLPQ